MTLVVTLCKIRIYQKNPSKYLNPTFWLVSISKWIDFFEVRKYITECDSLTQLPFSSCPFSGSILLGRRRVSTASSPTTWIIGCVVRIRLISMVVHIAAIPGATIGAGVSLVPGVVRITLVWMVVEIRLTSSSSVSFRHCDVFGVLQKNKNN